MANALRVGERRGLSLTDPCSAGPLRRKRPPVCPPVCRAEDAVPNGSGWIERLPGATEGPSTEGSIDPPGGSRAPRPPEFGAGETRTSIREEGTRRVAPGDPVRRHHWENHSLFWTRAYDRGRRLATKLLYWL